MVYSDGKIITLWKLQEQQYLNYNIQYIKSKLKPRLKSITFKDNY